MPILQAGTSLPPQVSPSKGVRALRGDSCWSPTGHLEGLTSLKEVAGCGLLNFQHLRRASVSLRIKGFSQSTGEEGPGEEQCPVSHVGPQERKQRC